MGRVRMGHLGAVIVDRICCDCFAGAGGLIYGLV